MEFSVFFEIKQTIFWLPNISQEFLNYTSGQFNGQNEINCGGNIVPFVPSQKGYGDKIKGYGDKCPHTFPLKEALAGNIKRVILSYLV